MLSYHVMALHILGYVICQPPAKRAMPRRFLLGLTRWESADFARTYACLIELRSHMLCNVIRSS